MNGHPNRVRLQLSLRERPLLPLEQRLIIDLYGVLEGTSRIHTLALPEILAEKVRAIHMRRAPRDLYDLWYLLRQGVSAPRSLMEEKLRIWCREATEEQNAPVRRVRRFEGIWNRDLGPLLPEVPPFSVVASEVEGWVVETFPEEQGQ